MSDDPKRKVLRDVRAEATRAERARAAFEKSIRDAAEHATVREIAEAAGLSPSRAHQIIRSTTG